MDSIRSAAFRSLIIVAAAACDGGSTPPLTSDASTPPGGDAANGSDAAAAALKEDGQSCQTHEECLHGHCVDLVCCQVPREECAACQACNLPNPDTNKRDGVCRFVQENRDPHSFCKSGACAAGTCDGEGGCKAKAPDTECATSCADGVKTVLVCGGALECPTSGGSTATCSPYAACNLADSDCATTCDNSSECAFGYCCSGSDECVDETDPAHCGDGCVTCSLAAGGPLCLDSGGGSYACGCNGSGTCGAEGYYCDPVSNRCLDLEWARWPLPLDQPPYSNYECVPGNDCASASNKVAVDLKTGLGWLREVELSLRTWADAKTYCETTLNTEGQRPGGFSDWRLPTKMELLTLESLPVSLGQVAINTNVFPGTPAAAFWASTVYVGQANHAWAVNFDGHNDSVNGSYFVPMTESHYVRCVRSETSFPAVDHYTLPPGANPATVTDNWTGLMWQRTWTDPNCGSHSGCRHFQAVNYCNDLSYGGYDDWRLPTKKELDSLVNVRRINPAIDITAFPANSPTGTFWSGTGYDGGNDPSRWWEVYFSPGLDVHSSPDSPDLAFTEWVRCVRQP